MEGKKPGIWIAAAVSLAIVVVALNIRRSPPQEEAATPATAPSAKAKEVPTPLVAPAADPSAPVATAPGHPVPEPSSSSANAPVAGSDRQPILENPPASPADVAPVSRDAAMQALDNVHFALRDFRVALGGNPEGTNAEITSALLGKNRKQVRMDLPDGSRVSAEGELCDPWGTPYFFHQLSAQKMEIRSAGPDRKMWTSDDIQM